MAAASVGSAPGITAPNTPHIRRTSSQPSARGRPWSQVWRRSATRDLQRVGDAAPPLLGGPGRAGTGELDDQAIPADDADLLDRQAVLTGEQDERRREPGPGGHDEARRTLAEQLDRRRVGDRQTDDARRGRPTSRPRRGRRRARRRTRPGRWPRARASMASRMNAAAPPPRARSSAGGPSSTATPAMPGVGRAGQSGRGLADQQDRVERLGEGRTDQRRHVVEQADDADLGGRGDGPAGRLVVERHVAAGDRQAQRPTGVAEAAHALLELPEGLRAGRVAVVEAVRDAQRPRAGDRDVASRLGHAQRRPQVRVQGADGLVAVRRRDEGLGRALDPQHRRPVAGSDDRVRPDRRVVLLEDGAARGEVRRAEEGQQHGAGVHPALRQPVARIERGAGRRSGPPVGRRGGQPLVDDRVARQRPRPGCGRSPRPR